MRTEGICTFCGLLCGDMGISASTSFDSAKASVQNQCDRASRGFHSATPTPSWHLSPLQQGKSVEPTVATRSVAQLLQQAGRTLFAGLATDVGGLRALLDVANRCGGIVDHLHSDALQVNLELLQQTGWIGTTLSEIRFRADVIVLVGDHLLDRFPRLLQRLQGSEATVGKTAKFFHLGSDDIDFRSQALLRSEVNAISVRKNQWFSLLQCMRVSLARDKSYLLEEFPANLLRLFEALRESSYSAWIWSAADFTSDNEELVLDSINQLVKQLNAKQRSGILPLAGSQGDTTAMQVCTWKTGFPLRQYLHRGVSQYDSRRYRGLDVMSQADCRCLFYVSTFEPVEPPNEFWQFQGPKIILGHPALKAATKVDYFLPAGIPGIDHDGHLFRGDGVSVLHAPALRSPMAPSAAHWLQEIGKQQDQISSATQSLESP